MMLTEGYKDGKMVISRTFLMSTLNMNTVTQTAISHHLMPTTVVTSASRDGKHYSFILPLEIKLFSLVYMCVYIDTEVFQSYHNQLFMLRVHHFPFMLSWARSIVNICWYKQYTVCVFKHVFVSSQWRYMVICVSTLSLYILSINAVNEKMMTGLQTSRQQVGKRNIPKLGQQPGTLGLLSLWANRCPSRAAVALNILPSKEKMCEWKWKKQGRCEKNTHGSMRWQCVECQEEWTYI